MAVYAHVWLCVYMELFCFLEPRVGLFGIALRKLVFFSIIVWILILNFGEGLGVSASPNRAWLGLHRPQPSRFRVRLASIDYDHAHCCGRFADPGTG